jgi:hypothetical protein
MEEDDCVLEIVVGTPDEGNPDEGTPDVGMVPDSEPVLVLFPVGFATIAQGSIAEVDPLLLLLFPAQGDGYAILVTVEPSTVRMTVTTASSTLVVVRKVIPSDILSVTTTLDMGIASVTTPLGVIVAVMVEAI